MRAAIGSLLIADDAFAEADAPVAALLRDALDRDGRTRCRSPSTCGSRPTASITWRDAVRVIQAYEIWQVYGRFVEEKHPRFGPGVAERMKIAVDHHRRRRPMPRARSAPPRASTSASLIKPGTVVALPTAPCIAPLIDTPPDALDAHRAAGDAAHLHRRPRRPAAGVASRPARLSGCPVGLSFIGWAGGDEALLDLAVTLSPHCGIAGGL